METQKQQVSNQERSSDETDLARISAEYDRSQIETEYPIPDWDDIPVNKTVDESVSSIFLSNLKSDISKLVGLSKAKLNKVLNHSETLSSNEVVDEIIGIDIVGDVENPHHLKLTLDNGQVVKYRWAFDKEHSTQLQQLVDYYADGDISSLKNTTVFVDEDGYPIVPNGSNFWFKMTNNLRPYGFTHMVTNDSKAKLSTISKRQRKHHVPQYDFSHRTYLNVCALLAPTSVILPIQIYSISSSVLLSFLSYTMLHLVAVPISMRSSNDENGAINYLFPWIMSIIGFIFLCLLGAVSAIRVSSYISTLFQQR